MHAKGLGPVGHSPAQEEVHQREEYDEAQDVPANGTKERQGEGRKGHADASYAAEAAPREPIGQDPAWDDLAWSLLRQWGISCHSGASMSRFPTPRPLSAFAAALVLPLALGACTNELAPELTAFESCDDYHSWVKASATQEVEYIPPPFSLGAEILPTVDIALGGDVMEEGVSAPSAGGGPTSLTQGGSLQGDSGNRTWSSTNVQEEGVDEADFVKNDGDHLFLLSADGLNILSAWPVESMELLATVPIEGRSTSLFFDAVDTVVVFSVLDWNQQPAPSDGSSHPLRPENSWDEITKATIVDVTDRSAPQVVRELYIDGALRSSRRIGSQVYVVTNNALSDFYWSQTAVSIFQTSRYIRESSLNDFLPQVHDYVLGEEEWSFSESPVADCTSIYRPDLRTDLNLVSVTKLDLGQVTAAPQSMAVLSRADTIYASSDALYLAMSEWSYGAFRSADGRIDTRIHKFSLNGGEGAPAYRGSGVVRGSLLNSFAMGEHEDILRVATTMTGSLEDGQGGSVSSAVFTLGEAGGSLEQLGVVDGIAPNESIFSVRFQGDRGYVVTFERIDPLFTLDLSDPAAPRVAGELEVTGFSTYLHPIEGDRLLAVGEEVDANGWEWLGMQVSIFDVSNFAAPGLEDRLVFNPNEGSEAQYDHHAFTFYEELQTLALPMSAWTWDGSSSGYSSKLSLLRVSEKSGLSLLGELDHTPVIEESVGSEGSSCGGVRRSIFIEDYVLAVSNYGVQAALASQPEQVLNAVVLPEACRSEWVGGQEIF